MRRCSFLTILLFTAIGTMTLQGCNGEDDFTTSFVDFYLLRGFISNGWIADEIESWGLAPWMADFSSRSAEAGRNFRQPTRQR